MRGRLCSFFRAFVYAARGIALAVKRERNLRFHLCAAVTVIMLSLFYDFSRTQYCVLFLCIGFVISAELINTAIEAAVDMKSGGMRSKQAGFAKDCSAGAVLAAAAASAACGTALFIDEKAIGRIISFCSDNIWAAPAAFIWLAAAFAFVFIYDGKEK